MKITDRLLEPSEYYHEVHEKTILVIHHTAGSHRPDWTIDSWEHDKNKNGGVLPVGTAYTIGGISSTDKNTKFDGEIYRAFDDKYWAHHLGLKQSNNIILNQKSVAIEICNYGPCTKNKDGIFMNYVGKPMPLEMVGELEKPWRGFKYYHKYTAKQLESLDWLLKDIVSRHPKIDLKKGMTELSKETMFEINHSACQGSPGLWTHVNYRSDKSDCWPNPELINLINRY